MLLVSKNDQRRLRRQMPLAHFFRIGGYGNAFHMHSTLISALLNYPSDFANFRKFSYDFGTLFFSMRGILGSLGSPWLRSWIMASCQSGTVCSFKCMCSHNNRTKTHVLHELHSTLAIPLIRLHFFPCLNFDD